MSVAASSWSNIFIYPDSEPDFELGVYWLASDSLANGGLFADAFGQAIIDPFRSFVGQIRKTTTGKLGARCVIGEPTLPDFQSFDGSLIIVGSITVL